MSSYDDQLREDCVRLFKSVADEILFNIIGIHPEACEGLSVEYCHDNEVPLIEIRFWEESTIRAKDIATKFQSFAKIPIEIIVTEKTSEFRIA